MDIVQASRTLTQNKLLEAVPTKWLPQAAFGMEAFALRSFQSAGSNARQVVANTNTARSKVYRLLKNEKLANRLGVVFDQLGLVRPGSYVNVDHSDFDGLTALVGAVQTRDGRAIPCMVETTYALHIPGEGSQNDMPRWKGLRTDMQFARQAQSFTGHTINALQDLHDRLGFWPKFVFDRAAQGQSGRHLKHWLDEIGFKTRRDKNVTLSQIFEMLNNPFYYGDFMFGGKLYKGIHEPLITKALFDQVQAQRVLATLKYLLQHKLFRYSFSFLCE